MALSKIQPAVYDEKTETENRSSSNDSFVEKVTVININRAVNSILERSPILKEMEDKGEITIVGAMYDIADGSVTFY